MSNLLFFIFKKQKSKCQTLLSILRIYSITQLSCSASGYLKEMPYSNPKFYIYICKLCAEKITYNIAAVFLTITHAAKGPKGLSCFEKQTAKHFLKLKNLINLGIPGKLYVDYFYLPFYNN